MYATITLGSIIIKIDTINIISLNILQQQKNSFYLSRKRKYHSSMFHHLAFFFYGSHNNNILFFSVKCSFNLHKRLNIIFFIQQEKKVIAFLQVDCFEITTKKVKRKHILGKIHLSPMIESYMAAALVAE